VQGWLWQSERVSADFRQLFQLQYNQWAGKGKQKSAHQLWPLPLIDERQSRFETAEDEYAWRAKMIEWAKNTGKVSC